jgi:Ca2+:H+ antiporter
VSAESPLAKFNLRDFLNLRLLLLLAPIAYLGQGSFDDVTVFMLSALALIPLAGLVGESTEEIASYIGPKWGGLLNATLGNAAELIITIFAISAGKLELVRASIIGSILGNLLLVTGLALFLGGLKHGTQKFDRRTASMSATLTILAMLALVIPSFFDDAVLGLDPKIGHSVTEGSEAATVTLSAPERAAGLERELLFSEGIALILILVYAGLIAYSFLDKEAVTNREPAEAHHAKWSMRTALGVMVASVLGIVFMSEVLVHAVEGVTTEFGLSELFIGVIIVPLVGNVAEHLVAVQVAIKNKMDLSMNISLGSSLQIALFVAPVLVFISLLFDDKLVLVFSSYELVALAAASFIAAQVAQDGESNWMEGAMLIAVYAVIGLAFFVIPG